MTRLYYDDSRLTQFDAHVVEVGEQAGRPWVVLDRTAFYPTSGGQPHDTGRLGEASVLDVFEREEGGAIVHVVDRPVPAGGAVSGAVDWARRRDHIQQHSGQHLLSAAFLEASGPATVSFHLGRELSTIDLDGVVDVDVLERAEALANEIVWQDRPVTVRTVGADDAAGLPLRKPPARSGLVRLVDIERFDLSACGGTHVSRTGEIGAIVLVDWERYKGGTRVSFVCGERALRRVHAWRSAAGAAGRALSVLPSELPEAIARLQEEQNATRQRLKAVAQRLSAFEAESLTREASRHRDRAVVAAVVSGHDAQMLKSIAQVVAGRPGYAVALVSDARPASVVVAVAPAVPVSAADLVRTLIERFGGRGGGRAELAQAGGLDAEPSAIRDAVRVLLTGAT